ncbi:LacI family DNA-binding transcriptional regulator [Georgenia sp. SYP-B2076]|uniref:LacI family DNA-binding transcriptional regulator n=1 Tax=Georgenia sp. SYP-B2076 TaxID=2495881 RepID=UPI000F8D77FE|nr:LacI family DNA-binding transcriptional regulator [Georgenia sp. SYP-B2076]
MRGRTRLTDVAEQAGVSTATVSRVLNGRPSVAGETRRAVLAALDLLGYERPDKVRARSAGLVGLIVPELSNPVFPAFAQAIESMLATVGITPLLCTQAPGGTTEDEYVEMLIEHEVDGIIFVSGLHADSSADPTRYQRLRERGVPFVLVNGTNPDVVAPSFSTDDRMSMDLAVRHLASQGHRDIGLAIGPDRFVPARLKREGFREAMSAYLAVADPQVVTTLYTVEGGAGAGSALIEAGCTAVICGSDLMALGVVRAARSRGMSVPDDLSVIGYDDSVLIPFTDPPLTTLRQPVPAMCQAAVATLVAEIGGAAAPHTDLLFVPELIVRSSTGAVADGARPALVGAASNGARRG